MRKCTAYAQAAKNRLKGPEIPPSGNSDSMGFMAYSVPRKVVCRAREQTWRQCVPLWSAAVNLDVLELHESNGERGECGGLGGGHFPGPVLEFVV